MTYRLDKDGYSGELTLELNEGFEFTPKISSPIEIKKVTIYDQSLTNWFIYNRFLKKYRKLVAMVISILQADDSSDDDIKIALDEIVHQKQIMAVKYSKYLKEKEELEYQKKLDYLEKELKNKYLIQEYMRNAVYNPYSEMEEEKGKTR